MPPFLENLVSGFQYGGLQDMLQQGQLSTMLMLFFGFMIFRRIGLFSLTGLLPILLIVGLLFSQDAGARRVIQDAGFGSFGGSDIASGGVMDGAHVDYTKYLIIGAIFLFLFGGSRLFMPLRGMSLGSGLLLIGVALLLSGRSVSLPEHGDNRKVFGLLLLGVVLLFSWRLLGYLMLRFQLSSQFNFHKKLARLQLETQAMQQLAATNPAAYLAFQSGRARAQRRYWLLLGAFNLLCVLLLYFKPQLAAHVPGWRATFSPYVFVGSLACLSLVVVKLGRSPMATVQP